MERNHLDYFSRPIGHRAGEYSQITQQFLLPLVTEIICQHLSHL